MPTQPQTINPLEVFSSFSTTGQSILDVFVLQDLLDYEDAEKLKNNFKTNREIENFLVKNRLVDRNTINKAYSILFKIPYIGLAGVEISDEAKMVVPRQLASKYGIIPFDLDGKMVRLAIARPSDLLVGYSKGIAKIFADKGLVLEVFITGETDFKEALQQYSNKSKGPLLKKGSLPVVYLRNQKIKREYLEKIPRRYVERYRIVVFGQNAQGQFRIACQDPTSKPIREVLDYIQKQNKVGLEIFAASAEDFDYILTYYRDPESVKEGSLESLEKTEPKEEKEAEPTSEKTATKHRDDGDEKIVLPFSLKGLFGNKSEEGPNLTIDTVYDQEDKGPGTPTADSEIAGDPKDELPEKVETKPLSEKTLESVILDKPEEVEKDTSDKNKEESTTKEKVEVAEPIPARRTTGSSFSGDSLDDSDIGSLLEEQITDEKALQEVVSGSYIPKIVAGIISYALNKKVSDVHIEPQAKSLRVRVRIDGVLVDVAKIDLSLHPPIISRIKILSKLKLDETRIPQDGRFDVTFKDKGVDVRVSIMPTVHGEKIVLRILDKNQKILTLEDLGMRGTAFDETVKAITKPWGIILSTGPTGSGKSTTLNAIIARLNQPGVNISTLEDPVEYETPGVNQAQVKPEIGFTFATGLRSLLRQDPNVIMVGEIRDGETAAMATHAALTGHLVLSTLHTNDTAGALPRLINMGIEPFLITSSMDLVIAQRLVRQICPKCKEEMKVPAKLMEEIKEELAKIPETNTKDSERVPKELRFFYGRGCSECSNGYKGRIGLFEVMAISPEIENLAIERRPSNEIKAAAIKSGMVTMKQDGIMKALAGQTTLDEVFRATMEN